MKYRNQKGTVLLASLILILIITMLGFISAKQGRINEKLIGSNQRYSEVFEAAQISLDRAVELVRNFDMTPFASDQVNGTSTRMVALRNLSLSGLTLADPIGKQTVDNAFVWQSCSVRANCDKSYHLSVDSPYWQNAILTTFSPADYGNESYFQNIQTYTIIEELQGGDPVSNVSKGNIGTTEIQATLGKDKGSSTPLTLHYYLITVKASGFPPGTALNLNTPQMASRENVILQMIEKRLL